MLWHLELVLDNKGNTIQTTCTRLRSLRLDRILHTGGVSHIMRTVFNGSLVFCFIKINISATLMVKSECSYIGDNFQSISVVLIITLSTIHKFVISELKLESWTMSLE